MESLSLAGGIVLRRPTTADIPGIFAVHGDPQSYQFDPQETHRDPEFTAGWLAPILQHWDEHRFGYWTALVPAGVLPTGVIAGMGGIRFHRTSGEQVLNVYFRFASAARGRGLAGSLLTAAIDWAADNLPGTDLVIRTRPANAAALRVGERAGFADDGLDPDDPTMVILRLRQPQPTGSVAERD
jgi:ribosomal-protein-alanine N-acetyltransferase